MGSKKQALLTEKEIKIDENSGSRACNRLDMQVSWGYSCIRERTISLYPVALNGGFGQIEM